MPASISRAFSEHSLVEEVAGPFSQKIHSFKNYKCASKKLFFAVDLYRADESVPATNYHHMRLNPFTKVNEYVLRALFDDDLASNMREV